MSEQRDLFAVEPSGRHFWAYSPSGICYCDTSQEDIIHAQAREFSTGQKNRVEVSEGPNNARKLLGWYDRGQWHAAEEIA